MAYSDPSGVEETSTALVSLLGRCTEQNSSEAFRSAIGQAIGALERNELVSAATIIDQTCANVAGLHDCASHEGVWPGPCPLQADEDATQAYALLGELRFRFGYLYLDKMPSNVYVLRG